MIEREHLARALERYVAKQKPAIKLRGLSQDGADLAQIYRQKDRFLKALYQDLQSQRYAVGPAKRYRVLLDKERWLYQFSISDRLVHGAFAQVLATALEPMCSDRLHSYRAGRSATTAMRQFARYVREHRRSVKDVRERGLYVYRFDVSQYTDSIPVDPQSPLWPMIDDLFASLSDYERQIIRALLSPTLVDGSTSQVGIPTGSPLTPVVANLYLHALDHELASHPGVFYLRFGDDVLVAAASLEALARAEAHIARELDRLGLGLNADKVGHYFFNGAARPSPQSGYEGTGYIDYLGMRLDFQSRLTLKPQKTRELLHSVSQIARQTLRLLGEGDLATRLRVTCQTLNQILDPTSPIAHPVVALIVSKISDRRDLKHLDYLIGRLVSERVSGSRGVRAFRQVGLNTLYERGGLFSFVGWQNRMSRGEE